MLVGRVANGGVELGGSLASGKTGVQETKSRRHKKLKTVFIKEFSKNLPNE